MNKRLPTIFVIGLLLSMAQSMLARRPDGGHKRVSGVTITDCGEIKFHNLNKYKAERWSQVFADPEVAPALKSLLRTDYAKLKQNLQEVNYPDSSDGSLSYVDKRGVLTLEGGVPGLYTIAEARLVIEPCGHIYAAILDNGERFLFFTNDTGFVSKLPAAFEDWRAKIEKARSENREVPKLPIVFKSR